MGRTDGAIAESFFERVYQIVRCIPYGRISTYGAVANFLGHPGAARMVGWAMNQSHSQHEYVPAHRVVNRMGLLTGKVHFGGSDVMKQLLENEGVTVVNDRVVDFNRLFWDPSKEHKIFPHV